MTATNNAVRVMAALVESGGRYIDGHNNQTTAVKYAAIFKRPDMEDMVVPLLTNTYFSLSAIEVNEDGVLRMSPWSVGGVVDSRGLTMEQTIAAFNESYKTSSLVELTEFEAKPEPKEEKPFFLRREAFYSGNTEGETHDAEGTIFYRNSYHNTISDKPAVDWQIARATGLKPNDVYVREYTEEGKIRNYVHLPVMEKLIEYSDFCNANGIQCAEIRNLDAIKAAIAQFYQLRGIIC